MLLAVRIYERKGAGLSLPLAADSVAGIVVAGVHGADTEQLHQLRPGHSSIPEPGASVLYKELSGVESGEESSSHPAVVHLVLADRDGGEENAATVRQSHLDIQSCAGF